MCKNMINDMDNNTTTTRIIINNNTKYGIIPIGLQPLLLENGLKQGLFSIS